MSTFEPATIGQTAILQIKKNGVAVSKYRPDLSDAEIDLSSVAKTNTTGSFTTITGGILNSCNVNLEPVQSGSGTPSPSNVRPITGHTAVEVTLSDDAEVVEDITVNLGGTYYGGTLDVVSGVLTVTHAHVDLGSYTWNKTGANLFYAEYPRDFKKAVYTSGYWYANGACECYKFIQDSITSDDGVINLYFEEARSFYRMFVNDSSRYTLSASDFKTAVTGQYLVYELSTPLTIQLTPQQINTLIGENHLDVPLEGQSLESLTYREVMAWDDVTDVVKAVDDKNADVSAMGTDESGRTTASKSYTIYSFFYKDGYFCRTQTAVAQGDTWTLGTNYIRMSVAELIYMLNNKVTQWGTLAGDVITVAKALGNNTISWYMNSNNPTNAPSNHKWGQYLIFKSTAEICAFIYFDPSAVCYASTNTLSTDTTLSWTGTTLSAI